MSPLACACPYWRAYASRNARRTSSGSLGAPARSTVSSKPWRAYRGPTGCRDRAARAPAACRARPQIPAAVVGSANVREQEVGDLLDGDPAAHDPQRRDAYALLVDLRCVAGEAARHHAADILPVRHHCHDREGTVVVEHRVEEPHVVEVRASRVGVVVQVQVARADVVAIPREHLAGRPRQGGDVGRLLDLRRGHELAGGGEHRRREVVALDDHVGVRGADDHGAHLAHDRREPRLDQLDGDGVEPARLDAGGPVGRAGIASFTLREPPPGPRPPPTSALPPRGRREGRRARRRCS